MRVKNLEEKIKSNQDKWLIHDLKSRTEITDELEKEYRRLTTWAGMRDAYWDILRNANRNQKNRFLEYCQRALEKEKRIAYKELFCDDFSFDPKKVTEYGNILKESGNKLVSYKQFYLMMKIIFEIPENRIEKTYFDLKGGDEDKQISFFLERLYTLFFQIPNGTRIIEHFFDHSLESIQIGLEGEPKKQLLLRDKYPYVNHYWVNFIREKKEELVPAIGKRACEVLADFQFLELNMSGSEDEANFEMTILSEGETFNISCAEDEYEWIDWFQYAKDEINFRRIFHMVSDGTPYYTIQQLFEEFDMKEHIRRGV